MSQGMPSMTALLGMVALAGYQNRDKITEMLTGSGTSGPNTGAGQSGLGGILGSLGGLLGGAGSSGSGGAGNLLIMVSTNCSIASSKMDRATRLNLGSSRVPIRRYHLLNSSRQSDPTCWRFWNKRQDFRNKSCSPDFRASFRQRLTSTRQTAACRGHRLTTTARTLNGQ